MYLIKQYLTDVVSLDLTSRTSKSVSYMVFAGFCGWIKFCYSKLKTMEHFTTVVPNRSKTLLTKFTIMVTNQWHKVKPEKLTICVWPSQ